MTHGEKVPRNGTILTVFMDEIPANHASVPFEEIGLEHLEERTGDQEADSTPGTT